MDKIRYESCKLDATTEEMVLLNREGEEVDRIDINTLLTNFLQESDLHEEE